jgi:prepilin-type N-terminal cleavage/methylation domain-containing protein
MKEEVLKKIKRDLRGFTLLELLVVIAIISILGAIVVVNLNGARDRMQKASLQSTMAPLISVVSICKNGGGKVLPPENSRKGGGQVCSNPAIIEHSWPDLSNIQGLENAGFEYLATSKENLAVGKNGREVVACEVESVNCRID